MKPSDIKIYELSLLIYSEIMTNHGKTRKLSEIKECLNTFERLEDYDKCRDLLEIIRIEFTDKNVHE